MNTDDKKQEGNIYGSFIEILRVTNGYAIYDFAIRDNYADSFPKATPIAICKTKKQLYEWMLEYWKDLPEKRYK